MHNNRLACLKYAHYLDSTTEGPPDACFGPCSPPFAGGERILQVFENRLTGAIRAINFSKQLESQHVKRVIEEADGYQPHLVAPEMGYRRLLQECLVLFKVRSPH